MNLTQSLHRNLQQRPDSLAAVDGNLSYTYAELGSRVARLAGGLIRLGVAAGDGVAMISANRYTYLEYCLAVPWMGGVMVPLNHRWSVDELAFAFTDSGARVLIVDELNLPVATSLRSRGIPLDYVICTDAATDNAEAISYEELVAASAQVDDVRSGGDDLAGIFYTGGTTGRSKGTLTSHRGLMTSQLGTLAGSGWRNGPGRVLHVAPLFHLAGLSALYVHSLLGSTHVFLPSFDVPAVVGAIHEHRITDMTLIPTMMAGVLDEAQATGQDLTSLQRLAYGSSPIAEVLLNRLMDELPNAELSQRYGMTELGPVATILGPADHTRGNPRIRSAGQAAPHAQVAVFDVEGTSLPPRTVGEIVVRGDNVMLGYLNLPDETSHALRGGWMHTGDAGYFDEDGYLFIVDRLKDMIVTGGENVYSAEVEQVLAAHPGVAACAVVGRPDDHWGERVHAVVVLRPDNDVTGPILRAFCKERIAGYKAPRTFEFVDELPMTSVGKVQKSALRE